MTPSEDLSEGTHRLYEQVRVLFELLPMALVIFFIGVLVSPVHLLNPRDADRKTLIAAFVGTMIWVYAIYFYASLLGWA